MSIEELIEKLEWAKSDVDRTGYNFQEGVSDFMFHAIILFEEIQKQLAKKENAIDIDSAIKEARLRNG